MNTQVLREKAVFCQALEISDPEQRREFLDRACGVDEALRKAVDKLLSVSERAGHFFKECDAALVPVAGDAQQVLSAAEAALDSDLPEGKRFGSYKLLQKIGEGGYGMVYMAEQEKPIRRRVALKIIKLGMDTRNVIARFEAERQALALMDHPNIARVLDAGATETGRPYFVMELVYGVKITEYCEQNSVSMKERLALFVQVCNAVQHAHQKGIIHRDLKPSNIMVTMHDGVPVPKVIDFGIAKATEQRLTDKTLFTSYAQLVGTPAYMSPEQMEFSGLNLDTRSDIYSLGVLLYELLTGHTPFDTMDLLKLGVDELRRTVREREPLSPSAKLQTLNDEELTRTARRRQIEAPRLVSQLRGDLDWIVLKCLEKDRTRRYATANALAMDIERHTHEEAVLARPPSRFYRLQKLIRRNRVAFSFGTTALTALLLGTIISTRMFLQEREARASEARFRKEAELREEASHVALLVTQRRFEEAEKLLAAIPLNKPSIELASELRALGDWHATNRRWAQAAEKYGPLTGVNEFDGLDARSLDQLRLATALLQAGDRSGYEQWREAVPAKLIPAGGPVLSALVKACLLAPPPAPLLQWLGAPETEKRGNTPVGVGAADQLAVACSDARLLLQYRLGDFSDALRERFLQDNAPKFATFSLVQAMAFWQMKDYWGAMMIATKGYALVQAGARHGLVAVPPQADLFSGMTEPDYLQAPWYDWAAAELVLREWSRLVIETERSASERSAGGAVLEQTAILRAAGEWHALSGEWADALRCFEYCPQHDAQDSIDHATMDYQNAAIASLKVGNQKRYLKLREEMPARFKIPDMKIADRALNVANMQSFDEQTAERLRSYVDLLRKNLPEQPAGYDTEIALHLALFELRCGQYTDAIESARRIAPSVSGAALPTAMVHVIYAMSLLHLGNLSVAQIELAQAQNLFATGFDVEFDVWHWRDWILLNSLVHEAGAMLSEGREIQPRPSLSN